MTDQPISHVVVCAGGLGTRVAPWAQHIPKEFHPVAGRPGILHLLDELTALTPVPPGQTAVLVRPYQPAEAALRGVVVSRLHEGGLVLTDLIEKPPPQRSRELEREHGPANLWLLEGRARLTHQFIDELRRGLMRGGTEPKLSLAIRRHAKTAPIHLIVTRSTVVDVGAPHREHASRMLDM